MDAAYRSELRELNELNFARFDAKVEQRFAEAKLELEQRLAAFEAQVIRLFGKVDSQFAELRAALDSRLLAHTRWMVGIWATVALAVLGLYLR